MPTYICVGTVQANGQEFADGAKMEPEIPLTDEQVAELRSYGAIREATESEAKAKAGPKADTDGGGKSGRPGRGR